MARAGVDLELAELGRCELVLREHALDRLANHFGRATLKLLAQGARLEAAWEAGVAVDPLLVEVLAGGGDLFRVVYDDENAPVDVPRGLRPALSTPAGRRLGRPPAAR